MHAARMLGLCATALTVLALLAGCQRPTTLTAVTGKVSYQGALLRNGLIVFTPDAGRGESGPIALGAIGEDGTYTLRTEDGAGASAGWYRVTVASFKALPKDAAPDRFEPPPTLLPDKYRDPQKSLLTCEVKPDRANTIDFNLD